MTDPDVMRVDDPRGDETPEWEVFLRETPSEPLRHAGSVSAPSATVAYDHASSLFGWAADTLWLCPASEVARFTDRNLGAGAEMEDPEAGSEGDIDPDGSASGDPGGGEV